MMQTTFKKKENTQKFQKMLRKVLVKKERNSKELSEKQKKKKIFIK